MSEQENIQTQAPDERDLLKERARKLGIEFSNNIGTETLRERINEKLTGNTNEPKDPEVNALDLGEDKEVTGKKERPLTIREKVIKENMKLIRVRIANLDPKKREIPGEVITVANEYLGNVRKYIPFGDATDGGYHIPYCIYKMLKRRKFLDIRVTKKNGREHITSRWVSEFALEVLDPLTEKELKQLAAAQQAAGSID